MPAKVAAADDIVRGEEAKMRTDTKGFASSGDNAVIAASILAWTDARFAAEQARKDSECGMSLLANPAGDPPRESIEFQLTHTADCPTGQDACFTQGWECEQTTISGCYSEACPPNTMSGCYTNHCGDTFGGCGTINTV